jgi:hypothetical protein
MRDWLGAWLVDDFSVLGVHLQNWMPVAVAIVVLWGAYEWISRRRRH